MTIHVIGSGETGAKWSGIGPSIGCNDSGKWGYPVDFLLLLNRPSQFQPSRLETIIKTTCKKVYTNSPYSWEKYFNNIHELKPLTRWTRDKKAKRGTYYHSNTSPFVGLSMAHTWGFNNVVMWGVDLITHHKYGRGQSSHIQEMLRFDSYIKALQSEGMKIYIGSHGTAFDHILPVWDKQLING